MKTILSDDRIFSAIGLPRHAHSPTHTIQHAELGRLVIKDETNRLGLGSFKPLGGVYAAIQLLQDQLAMELRSAPCASDLASGRLRRLASKYTLVCASAGNHGLAVATAASMTGAKARIYLPASAPRHFIERLEKTNAEVIVSGPAYEDAVGAARRSSITAHSIFLPDASDSIDDIAVSYVMEGYTRISDELYRRFDDVGDWPTDVFLQAGVGSLAAATAAHIRETWNEQPAIHIVEPDLAPCLALSATKRAPAVAVGAASVMHRLDCKEPSACALHILERSNVNYIQVSDTAATQAVAELRELGFATSPSGAAGFAGARQFHKKNSKPRRSLILLTEQADPIFGSHTKDCS